MVEASVEHLGVMAALFGAPLLVMWQRLLNLSSRIAVLEAKQDMIPKQLEKLTGQVEALCRDFNAFVIASAKSRGLSNMGGKT